MMVIWQSSRDSLYPYNNSIFPLCSSAFPEARHSRQYPQISTFGSATSKPYSSSMCCRYPFSRSTSTGKIRWQERQMAQCTGVSWAYSQRVRPSDMVVDRQSSPFSARASQLRYTVDRLRRVSLPRTSSYTSPAVRGRLFSRTFKIIIRAFVLFRCFFTSISSKLAMLFSL